MITSDLINTRISLTMMSGDRRQGILISVDEAKGTFTINWKKSGEQNSNFFRTELRTDRVESVTEMVRAPKSDTVPTTNENGHVAS